MCSAAAALRLLHWSHGHCYVLATSCSRQCQSAPDRRRPLARRRRQIIGGFQYRRAITQNFCWRLRPGPSPRTPARPTSLLPARHRAASSELVQLAAQIGRRRAHDHRSPVPLDRVPAAKERVQHGNAVAPPIHVGEWLLVRARGRPPPRDRAPQAPPEPYLREAARKVGASAQHQRGRVRGRGGPAGRRRRGGRRDCGQRWPRSAIARAGGTRASR